MELKVFRDPGSFWGECRDFLLAKEAENNLMIGVVLRSIQGKQDSNSEPYLACALEDGGVAAAAVMTAPFPLIITDLSEDASNAIAASLDGRGDAIAGVVGPSGDAVRFAKRYCERHRKMSFRVDKSMIVYILDALREPPGPGGKLRPATEGDLDLLTQWTDSFYEEVAPGDPRDSFNQTKSATNERRLFVWEDGEPVSMTAVVRETENGKAIALVYTPPEKRTRGYGTACVSGVCKLILDSGSDFCVLFADEENRTSNSVYQQIGFRPISHWTHLAIID